MPSKVKILPSDVLILIIDYLDSPTMMNCRQVCKSWLDDVDSNRSLWSYFYDTSLTDIDTTSNMLNLFSNKSNNSLKAFSVIQGKKWKARGSVQGDAATGDRLRAEIARERQDAKTYLDILLKSKESLRVLAYSDNRFGSVLMERFLDESAQFPNLKSIYFQRLGDHRPVTARIRQSQTTRNLPEFSSNHRHLLARLLVQDPWASHRHQAAVIETHQSTLLHLQTSCCGMNRPWSFPRLQALHLPSYKNRFPSNWYCPSLRLLTLSLWHGQGKEKRAIIDYFSPSVQYLWLMKPSPDSMPSLKRGGLDNLKKANPSLEILRIDTHVKVFGGDLVKMVKARKAAEKKGVEVEGFKMRAMKKLILDFTMMDSRALSRLQELVP